MGRAEMYGENGGRKRTQYKASAVSRSIGECCLIAPAEAPLSAHLREDEGSATKNMEEGSIRGKGECVGQKERKRGSRTGGGCLSRVRVSNIHNEEQVWAVCS
eukprot:1810194-Rhodomonas_salina.2